MFSPEQARCRQPRVPVDDVVLAIDQNRNAVAEARDGLLDSLLLFFESLPNSARSVFDFPYLDPNNFHWREGIILAVGRLRLFDVN